MTSPQKGRRYEKEHYSPEEMRALLATIRTKSATGVRNRALIVIMWQAGLRVSEALSVRPVDVDVKRREIFVREGKGGKSRRVRIAESTLLELDPWFSARSRLGLPDNAPLFCTLQGGQIVPSYVRDMMRRHAKKAGWTKRAHPHGLRHSFAVGLVQQNVSPEHIRKQLGHSSLATTSIYLQSLTDEDLADAMKEVTWE